ncbi:tRNA (guanosine(18)-2'-O)-methyltransferase [Arthrobacter agilis]|uniref:TrmH family RNA methyltransferase n=1 Tax=Arthrobacter agilis TaxID=37921 RepID=UPI000F6FB8EC|nr:RNA methyltransferase [Arthrobacter agilis]VDR31726.1 tRNA (guanosine(18)-2'-O)-methyltransferase [Arthrobacter agilis]
MTNTQADRVKEVARLAGRPSRLRRREFLAEGPQAVREALRLHGHRQDDGGVVVDVYATAEALDRHPDIAEQLVAVDAPAVRRVTADVLAAMSSTVTPQGFIAVCRFLDRSLDDVLSTAPRLVAVLVEVRDPGNAGTIIRAADSAGADAVILTGASVDPYNPKTVRSTVGSLFHLPLVIGAELDGLQDRLRSAGLTVLAADGYGPLSLDDLQDASASRRLTTGGQGNAAAPTGKKPASGVTAAGIPAGIPAGVPFDRADAESGAGRSVRLEDPAAWLFGNEAQGLAPEISAAADARVAVPIYGNAESLNVGTAATVCLYASARAQRLD